MANAPLHTGPISVFNQAQLAGALDDTIAAGAFDDYAPAGLTDATLWRLDVTGVAVLSGLDSTGVEDGRLLPIVNTGVANLVLLNQYGASVATNQFRVPNETLVVPPGGSILLRYSTTSGYWELAAPAENYPNWVKQFIEGPGTVAVEPNTFNRVDATGGATTIELPDATTYSGLSVLVENQLSGDLQVAPSGGNSISPVNPYPVPPKGVAMFTSDGSNEWVATAVSTSTGGGSHSLIFRPGGGDAGPVIFDTWAALYLQLQALRAVANGGGEYEIQFDNVNTTCTIAPAGDYDMTNVTWSAPQRPSDYPQNGTLTVSIPNSGGVKTFPGLRRFKGNLSVSWAQLTSLVTDLVDEDVITLVDGASLISASESGYFYDLSGLDSELRVTINCQDSIIGSRFMLTDDADQTVTVGIEGVGASITRTNETPSIDGPAEIIVNTARIFSRAATPSDVPLATGTTQNWAPSGSPSELDFVSTLLISGDAGAAIGGVVPPYATGPVTALADGFVMVLTNTGANAITINNEDGGSNAENRFALAGAVAYVLIDGDSKSFRYDNTIQRWRPWT